MDNLRGIAAREWWKLLRENQFAVDPAYLQRAWAVTMISLQNARMKREEDQRFAARVEATKIHPPIFILGHWRSGTTLLHELMALDTQLAYPNVYQVANPHSCLMNEEMVRRELSAADAQKRPMDNMQITMDSPGEDEAALAVLSLRSPVIAWSFTRREAHYDRYYTFRGVPQAEIAEWKQALVWFLKKLTYRYDKPLVLKSPAHTARIRQLLELFPEARFIHIQRDPYTVFRSTQQLYAKAVPYSYLQRPAADQVDDGIIRRYADMYRVFFEDRGLIPANQYYELRFEDLERDIISQVAAVYEHLKLPGFNDLEPRLQEYVAAKSGYKKNEHKPLAEPLRSKIAQLWHASFETWGYAA